MRSIFAPAIAATSATGRHGSGAPTDHEPDRRKPTDRPLKRMFDAVPNRYDLLNRVLTFGLDEVWRKRAAQRCLESEPSRVLDLCCGTGDLALHVAQQSRRPIEVVGLDYSPGMLARAREKAARVSAPGSLRFVAGDAASMEFPDGHFDAVGIAFAFRNLTWRNPLTDRALAEVRRVLRPGGIFAIVETSQPRSQLWRTGFHAYLASVVAPVGSAVSGQRGAYHYLANSARGFFDADEVCRLLHDAGFDEVSAEPLLGGIAALHVAKRGLS
jgi:demethylmenaquinone methyltransferase/2-methoxy-6-polyprenyl-1,4-benzoquinol methylase